MASPDDLDLKTVATCGYVNNFRADFGNDPFIDTGWIQNHINCDDGTTYNYLIVHQDDPRFTGNGIPTWGTREYQVLTQTGEGNTVPRPNVG